MSNTLQIRGELRPVHTLHALAARPLVVRDDGSPYGPPDGPPAGKSSPKSIPPDEAHARRIAAEAERWLAFATERTLMTPATLTSKALAAACFTTAKRASSLSVPTKLAGVRAHQRTLWALVRDRVPVWTPLELDVTEGAITVLFCGDVLGHLQPKHRGWVKPLVPFGAALYLSQVTGHERSGYTLGVNVVVGHVGEALDRLLDALGEAGLGEGGPGGDRMRGRSVGGSGVGGDGLDGSSDPAGDGATSARPSMLRLLTSPPALSLRSASAADPNDVVLFRDVDGTARATVEHVVRHNPSGIEWGYHGSGPADLARSVLLALTDEATAERHYQRFKAEVVAAVPRAGGVIRVAAVRAWLAAESAGQR